MDSILKLVICLATDGGSVMVAFLYLYVALS